MKRSIIVLSALALAALLLPAAALAAPARSPFGRFSKPTACAAHAQNAAGCLSLVITASPNGKPLVTPYVSGYGPTDLRTTYNLTTLSVSGGAGQTVAIVDAYDDPVAQADLNVYRSTFGLPATTITKVNQSGNPSPLPPVDYGWSDEISLDLDMVSAIAPNAHILLVEGNAATFTDLATAVNEAATLGATQISNSYGGGEQFGSGSNSAYNHPGVAVTASSGDGAYYGDGQYALFPASSQYVESVGGTSLTNTSPRTESVWSGAGSGCSQLFPKPVWQLDPSCAKRMVSDVSAVADPFTGVAVYDSNPDINGWAVFGGTSVSSPIVASVDALVGAAASTPQFPYLHPTEWNDVTTGSNGSCAFSYFCHGAVGYDGPTGLGTPNGTLLVPPPPPPAVPTITHHPPNPSPWTTAVFTFTDSTVGVTYQCARDGSGFSACASPKTYVGLAYGAHTFKVKAKNVNGTSGPAVFSWKIVRPPPPPVLTSKPPKFGSSAWVTFKWKDASSNVTYQCRLASTKWGACKTPLKIKLNHGWHTFYAEAIDKTTHFASAATSWTFHN